MSVLNDRDVHLNIQKALNGDSRAFEYIIRKYQKRLYYTVLQIVMNHDDTNDVIQETFIKAYTKLSTYDRSYPFYPWLYRIAVNTSLNLQKKKARLRALSLDDLDNNHHADLAESPRQMREMVGGELAVQIKSALSKIPLEQRTVFMLRVNDGLSYQEISDTLAISIGTVMSRLSRARDKLRSLLQNYLETKDIEV